MRPSRFAVSAALAGLATAYEACNVCTNNSTEPLSQVPAPWTLKGTVYSITILPTSTKLPVKAFSPLERDSHFRTAGDYVGILGMIQIIRYTDGPTGPYDELLILPGYFDYERERENGTVEEQTKVRISRIYVSNKYACYNGRASKQSYILRLTCRTVKTDISTTDWNTPKHLARFDWTESDCKTTVKVYPHDTTGDLHESFPASKPWFQTTFSLDLLRDIPFTTDVYEWVGINATLAQPPMPYGPDASLGELVGTDFWAATVPGQVSDNASVGLFDLYQPDGGDAAGNSNGTNAVGDEYFENFWPGMPRWTVGLKMDNATISFGASEYWA